MRYRLPQGPTVDLRPGPAIAWEWICAQAWPGVRDPRWFRRDSVDAIAIIFAQLSHRISDCRLPLDVGPTVAAQLFDMRNILSGRRIENNQWGMDSHHPECRESYEVLKGHIERARARLALEQARLRTGTDEDIRDENGNIAHDPSDDEMAPHLSEATLATHTPFPALDPTWNAD